MQMLSCTFCSTQFVSLKSLNNHMNGAKYCQSMKHFSMTCSLCNFTTNNLLEAQRHTQTCDSLTDSAISRSIIGIEPKKEVKIISPTSPIKEIPKLPADEVPTDNAKNAQTEQIYRLELEIAKLKCYNSIYYSLITSNTDIKLTDFMEEYSDKKIALRETDTNIKMDVVVSTLQNNMGDSVSITNQTPVDNITISNEKTMDTIKRERSGTNKKHYRKLKGVDVVTETKREEENVAYIHEIDKQLESDVVIIDEEDYKEKFNQKLVQLEGIKSCDRLLNSIKQDRQTFSRTLSLAEYVELLKVENLALNDVFTKKEYALRKKVASILKAFTPLENRILFNTHYQNQMISAEDIEHLEEVLEYTMNNEKNYYVFDFNTGLSKFANYSLVLYPVLKLIEVGFFNRYGFNNLIYLDIGNQTDPYSYFYLSTNNHRRRWTQDNRLYEFTMFVSNNIWSQLVFYWRKIYKTAFNDNIYRANYAELCENIMEDLNQLLLNLVLICQPMLLNNTLRQIVRDKATYIPTDIDKFDCQKDNESIKNEVENTFIKEDALPSMVREIFDDISMEDTVDFIRDNKLRDKLFI